ncbi:MAG: hypothetical protein AB8B86_10460 [Pseudomonadales bacterium]
MFERNHFSMLAALIAALMFAGTVGAQQNANSGVANGGGQPPPIQQLDNKDPNRIVITQFRLRGKATPSQNEYSIPIRLWPSDCTSCQLISKITERTEVVDGDGDIRQVHTLKANHTYEAISIQFDDDSIKEIVHIQLVPKN